MKEGITLKDLNCSIKIHFNTSPIIEKYLVFKLDSIDMKLEECIECREYQIKGMLHEDVYCYLTYKIFKGKIKNPDTKNIEEVKVFRIEDINVNEDFRRQGLGTKMYEILSGIYMECYQNYKIKRKFVNPFAEYAFRKAVENKKVDETLFQNSEFDRQYTPSQNEIMHNLMQKLSKNYRDEI